MLLLLIIEDILKFLSFSSLFGYQIKSRAQIRETYLSVHPKFACSINLAAFTKNIKNDLCGGTENCIHSRG